MYNNIIMIIDSIKWNSDQRQPVIQIYLSYRRIHALFLLTRFSQVSLFLVILFAIQ